MNTKLPTEAKMILRTKWIILFLERQCKKLVTTDKRRNSLVLEPHCHSTKWFFENLLATETKEIKVKMNNPAYLGFSVLENSKMLMYEFWYDYIRSKFQNNAKLCYLDTESLII